MMVEHEFEDYRKYFVMQMCLIHNSHRYWQEESTANSSGNQYRNHFKRLKLRPRYFQGIMHYHKYWHGRLYRMTPSTRLYKCILIDYSLACDKRTIDRKSYLRVLQGVGGWSAARIGCWSGRLRRTWEEKLQVTSRKRVNTGCDGEIMNYIDHYQCVWSHQLNKRKLGKTKVSSSCANTDRYEGSSFTIVVKIKLHFYPKMRLFFLTSLTLFMLRRTMFVYFMNFLWAYFCMYCSR